MSDFTATGTERQVCLDISDRQRIGVGKYGTTVADNPLVLREWLQHAYEETLDKAVYLKRAIQSLGTSKEVAYDENCEKKETRPPIS